MFLDLSVIITLALLMHYFCSTQYYHDSEIPMVWVTLFLPLGYYSIRSVYSNLLEWYLFVAAWNQIHQLRRADRAWMTWHQQVHRKQEMWLRQEAIRSFVYDNGTTTTGTKNSTSTGGGSSTNPSTTTAATLFSMENNSACPICLQDFQGTDRVSTLKTKPQKGRNNCCGQLFHQACIQMWLQKHPSCPCCRSEVWITVPPALQSGPPKPWPTAGTPPTNQTNSMMGPPQQQQPRQLHHHHHRQSNPALS